MSRAHRIDLSEAQQEALREAMEGDACALVVGACQTERWPGRGWTLTVWPADVADAKAALQAAGIMTCKGCERKRRPRRARRQAPGTSHERVGRDLKKQRGKRS